MPSRLQHTSPKGVSYCHSKVTYPPFEYYCTKQCYSKGVFVFVFPWSLLNWYWFFPVSIEMLYKNAVITITSILCAICFVPYKFFLLLFFFFFHKSERINQSIVGFKVLTCNKPFKFHPRGWMLLTSINSGDGDCENQAVMLQLRVRYSSTSQNICWPGCLFHSSLDFIGWFSYLHN